MPCSCRNTECSCENICFCCPFECSCVQCLDISRHRGAHCRRCGGFVGSYICNMIPVWKSSNYPNLDFLRATRGFQHGATGNTSDERARTERVDPKTTQSSSTASRRSDSETTPSSASRRSDPENTPSPPGENDTFDDDLIFQMDDIDPPEVSTKSTGAKSRDFRGSSHFGSNTSVSDSISIEQRESPSKLRPRNNCSPCNDLSRVQRKGSPNSKMPIWTSLQNPDSNALRESQNEVPITENIAGCSRNNPIRSISEIGESRVSGESQLRPISDTDLNRTELLEREISTTEGDPGCSHNNLNIAISKEEKFKIINNASYAVSPTPVEYARNSLPSNLHSGDSPPSSFPVSPRPPSLPLSTSAPSVHYLQPTELISSEQKTSTALGTSETSPVSELSELDTLRTSYSHPKVKSRTSSRSIEILPENVDNGARYDTFHGQPGIPSVSVASSQLNNTIMQAKSSQAGTTRAPSLSNSLELSSSEMSASARTSSKSDSIETMSQERTESSEDEAQTNKSPKRNN